MKKLLRKVKFWFWWYFKASDKEKTMYQAEIYGTGFSKEGKFVDCRKVILNPKDRK